MSEQQALHAAVAHVTAPNEHPACGDGGCIFGHRGGMTTNAGCAHLRHRYEHLEMKRMLNTLHQAALHLARRTDGTR